MSREGAHAQRKPTPDEIASAKLIPYCVARYPKYEISLHNQVIAEYLEAVERGEITRLLLTLPPRHGKTLLLQSFIEWYMGRHPSDETIYATYSGDKAQDVGENVKNAFSMDEYRYVFPNVHLSGSSASKSKMALKEGGNLYFVGINEAITGRGANCLSKGTLIETNIGQKEISWIIEQFSCGKEIKVLSWDEGQRKPCYNKILATRSTLNEEIFIVRTSAGRTIEATGDHRFYVLGKGFIKARSLCRNDCICVIKQGWKKKLRDMWKKNTKMFKFSWNVQRLLYESTINSCRIYLQIMWKNFFKNALRYKKDNHKGICRYVLFSRMFDESSCNKKSQKMRNMWKTLPSEACQILFKKMQTIKENITSNSMRFLQQVISANITSNQILLKAMPEFCSFGQDDRRWKFTFQRWNELCKMVQVDETSNSGTRSSSMRKLQWEKWLWTNRWITRSSYRRKSKEQQFRKSHNALQKLPHDSSQIECDTISMVSRVCKKSVPVYDIQVERNSNFFANQILVHNCLIIDDPIKREEDAMSRAMITHMHNWYTAVAYTRLMPRNFVIVCHTRWTTDDLIGWLIKEHKHENWVELRLPAIAEHDDLLGRKIGEALWPGTLESPRYPAKVLHSVRKTMKSLRRWNAIFQQRPVPEEGALINKNWFSRKYYRHDNTFVYFRTSDGGFIQERIIRIVQSWDTAYKAAEINDPSACTTWAVTRVGYALIHGFKEKLEYPALKKKIFEMDDEFDPSAVLVEDRSSGQSLIQEFKDTPVPVIGVQVSKDKTIRMKDETDVIEAGKVFLPEFTPPWLEDFLDEVTVFPYGSEDDYTDTFSMFLHWIKGKVKKKKRKPPRKYWK